MSKEYYFFQHKSGLYKQDLDFILSHGAEGYGVYMIALELIIDSQFTITVDRLKNQLSRFADSEIIEEAINSLIEAGEFYINEDDFIHSSLLSQEIHKKAKDRIKARVTGIFPRIKKLYIEEGTKAVAKKYKEHFSDNVYAEISDSKVGSSDESVRKFCFHVANKIVESKESK